MSEKRIHKVVQVVPNPLTFVQASGILGEPNAESVLEYLCTPGLDLSVDAFVSRYKQLTDDRAPLGIAPADQRILDKLIWPLRHAIANYMTGNHLGVIALSGLVAEMIAILIFELSEFKSKSGAPVSHKEQQKLFGRKFEDLGQERRVEVLEAFGLVNDRTKQAFGTIRAIRRRYLHLWSQDHERLPSDAQVCYKAAATLVSTVIGQGFKDWAVTFNPKLMKYLEKSGIFGEMEEQDEPTVES